MTWICQVRGSFAKTVLVEATSRKDALERLRRGEGEGIDLAFAERGYRVIRKDGAKPRGGRL